MQIESGDTAWVLAATAMVLLMTPGLAFFYGGMVRSKSVLNMLVMSFFSIGIVSVLWTIFGYGLAFGDSGSGIIGALDWSHLGSAVNSFPNNGGEYPIPELSFSAFQLMFAVITPAIISGAIADRTKLFAWGVFVAIWVTIVYFPVAHWVFDLGTKQSDGTITGAGWLAARGVLDFAGGTAVHINAGAAGLALAIVLGKRVGFGRTPMKPHNLPLVLIGAGLLWFGWFGFNAGSALGANATAALALMNTQASAAAALLGWLLVERLRDGHATILGAGSGAIAGLVAITPACAYVAPWAAVVIGLIAGAICSIAVGLKYKLGFDDSLDVVGLHLTGGIVGCLAVGFFGSTAVNPEGANGIFYGGGPALLGEQALGIAAVAGYSFVVTLILGYAIKFTIGFRIKAEEEAEGIDISEHLELAYELNRIGSGGYMGDRNFTTRDDGVVKR